jgi:hypothetical protein
MIALSSSASAMQPIRVLRMSQSAVDKPSVDDNHLLLAACTTMTGLARITMAARIHARGWMTYSTDRDDYTIWVATVGGKDFSGMVDNLL